ncbi:hypothetical protein EDB80DRAFT_418795 [Ilyonectria destructans]|nr:hypothetical protein EDB80DRAFT_383216 [Ilyonectria destructans]KAH7010109.1 hypothetical protein EDB80DRAFT_418795 [Ilyonectria destructans]
MRHFWKRADGYLSRILPPVGLFVLLASLILTTNAQAIDANLIDITKYPDWNDLRTCVQCWLTTCSGNIFEVVGCKTNACACRASTLGSMIPILEDGVLSYCSNFDDASTAVSVLKGYCSEKGYTSIIEPTVLETTGAFTVTAFATTVYVTVTMVQNEVASAAPSDSGPLQLAFGVALLACLMTLATPTIWIFRLQRLRREL